MMVPPLIVMLELIEVPRSKLPSVAEAEERFEAAKRESARVQSLHSTLDQTLEFLRAAQEVVHRDIAPVLNETLRRWLPELTSGRYVDAAVDPASLDVQVLTITGKWRTAKYLSQGTREQVYLLLRVALAQHLTSRNEVIPLILDDVTVQCDASRTCRLLEILHKISKERQVVLFAQDEEVLLWARSNLNQERDQLIELDPAAVQA